MAFGYALTNASVPNFQICQNKEKMIQSQYLVVDGLKNMTSLQDKLTKAKDMALKILQNTVYQMVDRIHECSNTAVKGKPILW